MTYCIHFKTYICLLLFKYSSLTLSLRSVLENPKGRVGNVAQWLSTCIACGWPWVQLQYWGQEETRLK